jgi:hypothetical protein
VEDSPGVLASEVGIGVLGIGSNSTFVNTLVASGAAPANSWGLWVGSRSVWDPVDGLMVIGGFDTARINGQSQTFESFNTCFMCTVVADLTYEHSNGSKLSLFTNRSEILQIALQPFSHTLSLPQDIYDNFQHATGAVYDPSQASLIYNTTEPPRGNLSVTFANGYTTVIPWTELFTPPRQFSSSGVYSITNDSILLAEVSNDTDPSFVANFGLPFLTMNYLTVNASNETLPSFSLAPAYRNSLYQGEGTSIQKFCTGSGPRSSHKNHPKEIAGAVVGGVLGIALILLALYFWRRRKVKAQRRAQPVDPVVADDPGRLSDKVAFTRPRDREDNVVSELSNTAKCEMVSR